jgi:hypothetical protein
MSLTKLFLDENYSIIPGKGDLVSDIPARDGITANLFYSVRYQGNVLLLENEGYVTFKAAGSIAFPDSKICSG